LAVLEYTPLTNLDIAYKALKKGQELDDKRRYERELVVIKNIKIDYDNTGRALLNVKKFPEALNAFERAYEVSDKRDTLLLYLCAISAENAGNYTVAKDYYQKMVDVKFIKENTYNSLATIYLNLKDTANADRILKAGRLAQPENTNLLIMEVNYWLRTNNKQEALSLLNKVITNDLENANLRIVRGSLYDNMILDMGDVMKDTIKQKKYFELIKLAEQDYLKVIALNPTYFEAHYSLGVLYNNQAVVINTRAEDVFSTPAYKGLKKQANDLFIKARPILEKAHSLEPTDRNTMIALRQLYTILDMRNELKVMNDKLGL
jgi:tetratricopeptide (TPR) repeat protein